MKHELAVMGSEGDVKTIWDSENEHETEAAKKQFQDLKKKGYLAFRVKKGGEKGELMTEWDESAQSIIMSPPVRGG